LRQAEGGTTIEDICHKMASRSRHSTGARISTHGCDRDPTAQTA
jgi:hypothetical protein